MIEAAFYVISTLVVIYKWVVILDVILSNLISFGVLNTGNRPIWMIADALDRATRPALRPIRQRLPNFGGIDFSPIILIVLLQGLQILLFKTEYSLLAYVNY